MSSRKTPAQIKAEEEAKLPTQITIPGTDTEVDILVNDGRKWLLKFPRTSYSSYHLYFVKRQFFPPNVIGGLQVPVHIVPGILDSVEGPHVLVPVAYLFKRPKVSKPSDKTVDQEVREVFGSQDLTSHTLAWTAGGDADRRMEYIFNPDTPIPALVRYNPVEKLYNRRAKEKAAHFDVLDQTDREPMFGPFYPAAPHQRPQLDKFVQDLLQSMMTQQLIPFDPDAPPEPQPEPESHPKEPERYHDPKNPDENLRDDGRLAVEKTHFLVLMEEQYWINLWPKPPFYKAIPRVMFWSKIGNRSTETVPLAVRIGTSYAELHKIFRTVTIEKERSKPTVPVIIDTSTSLSSYLIRPDRQEGKMFNNLLVLMDDKPTFQLLYRYYLLPSPPWSPTPQHIEAPPDDAPPNDPSPADSSLTDKPGTDTPSSDTPAADTPATPGQDVSSDRLVRPYDTTRDPRQARSNEAASVPPPEPGENENAPNQTANDPPTTGEPVKDPLAMLVEESEIPQDLVDDTAGAPTLGAPRVRVVERRHPGIRGYGKRPVVKRPPADNPPKPKKDKSRWAASVRGIKRPRGRPKGRLDSKPRSKRVTTKKPPESPPKSPSESPPDLPPPAAPPKVPPKPKSPPKPAPPLPAYATMPSLDQLFNRPNTPPSSSPTDAPFDSPEESRSRTGTPMSPTEQVTRTTVAKPAASTVPSRTTIEIVPDSDEEDGPEPVAFVELYSKSPASESSSGPESPTESLSSRELSPNLRSPNYLASSPDPESPTHSLSSGELSPNLKSSNSDGSNPDQNLRHRRRDYTPGMDSDHTYSMQRPGIPSPVHETWPNARSPTTAPQSPPPPPQQLGDNDGHDEAMETDPFQDLTSELDQTGFSLPPLNVPQYQEDDHGYHQVGVPTIEAQGPIDIVEGQPSPPIPATDQEFIDELMNDIDTQNEQNAEERN